MPQPVFIASDHRGFSLKNKLKLEHPDFIDLGPSELNPNDDYNDSANAVAKKVLETPGSKGILICGSAIGVSIQANRHKGVRAAVVSDLDSAIKTREHNDANILCLSSDKISDSKDPLESEKALEDVSAVVNAFLETDFSNEPRHVRRIKKLDEEL
ncbi:RpiB/LacA/LacB family sugar-phosphate isomerase [Candidatus Saccharibacteria bacterium]|nr:RpiB/LacA/LacB family sugar-phosphate isomerase [Candidatus Saccharibacteria bacterium]